MQVIIKVIPLNRHRNGGTIIYLFIYFWLARSLLLLEGFL